MVELHAQDLTPDGLKKKLLDSTKTIHDQEA
jgi:hypothetical protein